MHLKRELRQNQAYYQANKDQVDQKIEKLETFVQS